MYIISGKLKGKKLTIPQGIRATQNKTRKALFDILQDISGLSFLDLFAGSGSVGIEAISYGAEKVMLVENNGKVLKALSENIVGLLPKQAGLAQVRAEKSIILGTTVYTLPLDVDTAIKRLHGKKELFNLVFLDPPYYKELAKKTLQTLDAYDIVAPSGLICVQHFSKDSLPERLNNFRFLKQYKYGDTRLSLYRKASDRE